MSSLLPALLEMKKLEAKMKLGKYYSALKIIQLIRHEHLENCRQVGHTRDPRTAYWSWSKFFLVWSWTEYETGPEFGQKGFERDSLREPNRKMVHLLFPFLEVGHFRVTRIESEAIMSHDSCAL